MRSESPIRAEGRGSAPTTEAYKASGEMILNDLLLLRHKDGTSAVNDALRDAHIEAELDLDGVTPESAKGRALAKHRAKIAERAGDGKRWVVSTDLDNDPAIKGREIIKREGGEVLLAAYGDETYRYAILQTRNAIANLVNSVAASPADRKNPETVSQALKLMREHVATGGNVEARVKQIARWDAAAAKKAGRPLK